MSFKLKDGLRVGSQEVIDSSGKILTAFATPVAISLSGDVVGSANFDGSTGISISTTIQPNSVTLGTDTTGAYVADIVAGGAITLSETANNAEGNVVTVSHSDTSSQASVNNSGNTFIQDVTLDGYGHVTGLTSAAVVIGNGAFTVTAGSGLTGGGQLGTANQSSATSVTISHADTSSQASVNNSNGVVIQDVTLDGYGHVTGLASIDLDSRFVNVTGDTMTGALYLSDGYGITNVTDHWVRQYSVNNVTPATLLDRSGNPIDSAGAYRFSAHVQGTGTDNWATAVFWNVNGSWRINVTQQSGTSSNHPEFILSGGVPTLIIDHTSLYGITVYGERLILNEEATGTDNAAAFGADSFMSNTGALRYNPNGAGTDYSYGYNVWHSGNDGSGSGLDADLLDGHDSSYFSVAHSHPYLSLTGGELTGSLKISFSGFSGIEYYNAVGGQWQGYIGTESSGGNLRYNSYSGAHTWYANSTTIGWMNADYFYHTSDIRTPIFYDSDNTGYYGNFASTSNLNLLTAAAIATGAAGFSGGGYDLDLGGSVHAHNYDVNYVNQIHFYDNVRFYDNGNDSDLIYKTGDVSTGAIIMYDGNGTRRGYAAYWDSAGIGMLSADASWGIRLSNTQAETYHDTYVPNLYAYIMYDRNDTGYYTDPSSISSMYGVAIRGDANSTDSRNQIFFWNTGDTTTSAIGFKSNGGEFTNPTGWGDGYNTYLTMDTDGRGWVFRRGTGGSDFTSAYNSGWILNNGVWQANSSMRAPIFYDSNDTGYWVDPNSGGFNMKGGTSNRVTYSTNDSGFKVNNAEGNGVGDVRLGAAWGAPGVYSSSYLMLGSENYIEFRIQNSQKGYIDSSANLFAFGSMRSPIFYDSNNTGYYVDPASSSKLNKIILNNIGITAGITSLTDAPIQTEYADAGTTSTWYPLTWQRARYSSGYVTHVNTGLYKYASGWGGGQSGWYCAVGGNDSYPTQEWRLTYDGYLYNSLGYVTQGGSFRAPIFYDSSNTSYYWDPGASSAHRLQTPTGYLDIGSMNSSWCHFQTDRSGFYFGTKTSHDGGISAYDSNDYAYFPTYYDWNDTGYYVDPNSTSTSYRGRGEILLGPNSSSRYFRVGGNGGATDYATISASNGNLHLDAQSGSNIYLGWYNSSVIMVGGGIHSTIYYDRNNTGYYADPASTSRLNVIDADGEFRANYFKAKVLSGSGIGDSYDERVVLLCPRVTTNTSWNNIVDGTITALKTGGNVCDTFDVFCHSVYNDTRATFTSRGQRDGHTLVQCTYGGITWIAIKFSYTSNPYNYFLFNGQASTNVTGHGDNQLKVISYYDNNGGGILNSEIYNSITNYGGSGTNWKSTASNYYFGDEIGSTYWTTINSDYLSHSSDIRAPIFYDSNNTGYYVDPNSTSNMYYVSASRFAAGYDAGVANSMSCSDWFRSSGSTGWYNASYGGGVYMQDSTWVRVYNSKAFYVANQIAATGNVTAYYSDERLKTRTGLIENAIDKVCSLDAFYYVENDLAKSFGYNNDKQQVALSAQQVKEVQPEAVSLAPFDIETLEDGTLVSKSGEEYLTVDYARLVPLLVQAIKEQQQQIDELKALIQAK